MILNPQDAQQRKQGVKAVFDLVSSGYDNAALRFFPFCADALVDWLHLKPGDKVLDVACGTGVVTTAAAQRVVPSGRVHAIDFADAMLNQAQRNVEKMRLTNVDFHCMDAEVLEFRDCYFDAVICSFGIFFLPQMENALAEWLRVLKPGGTLAFTSFSKEAFQPMVDFLRQDLANYGVQGLTNPSFERLTSMAACEALLVDSGAMQVEVINRQFGYYLANIDEWWAALWNAGFRGWLEQLSRIQLEDFKIRHFPRVQALADDKGIWMDVSVNLARAVKSSTEKKMDTE